MKETNDFWQRYLKQYCIVDIERIRANYPADKTVVVDVSKISNNQIWENTLDTPKSAINDIVSALSHFFDPEKNIKPVIRFVNVSRKKQIRDIRSKDEGNLISIKCLIKRVTDVRPKILSATFKCGDNHFTDVKTKYEKITVPLKCSREGCKYRTFSYISEKDIKVDRQFIYVQEILEDLQGGIQPTSLKCEVVGDLCNRVFTGDRITLNGIVRSLPKFKEGSMSAGKDIYFEVNSIESGNREFDEISWTGAEEDKILKLAGQPDIFEQLTDSIAPSIMGVRLLKQCIVLMLFEGVRRTMPDGTSRRAHINILVVGDPGVAKTEILDFVHRVAIRGAFAVANTSSKVGLIAPVIKDENGQYAVEAGPYVLANGGVFCLDEVGELSKEDFKYLAECMEKGQCHISKGGLNVTVQTRASLLAACNPTGGNYDRKTRYADQLKIPEQILSRFDLKLLITDDGGEEKDRALAQFIGKTFRKGFKPTYEVIPPELLRKYFAYARNINPEISEEAEKVIEDYYVQIRRESQNPDKMRVTNRQLTSIYHLAEAFARLHLRETVTAQDAEFARDIFDMAYRNVNTDSQGKLTPGMSDHKTRESLPLLVIRTIADISGGDNGSRKASEMSVTTALKKKGYDQDRIESTIRALLREGKLSEPVNGLLKVE